MKKNFLCAAFCCIAIASVAQNVGIGTPIPNPSALLDLTSSSKGFLLPRVILSGANDNSTIPNAAYGLMVINENELEGEGAGVYIQTGTLAAPNWRRLGLASGGWALQGNSGATGAVLGHLDSRPLQFVVGGSHIARLGGNSNILLGLNSGTALPQTTDFNSYNNIIIGNNAMPLATSGTSNIAIGNLAMQEANGGSTGIAIGGSALRKQSSGALENIAIGFSSQAETTSGSYNVSFGRQSLSKNTIGSKNVAQGSFSLEENTTGTTNVAVGHSSAAKNTTGFSNVAIGASALFSNTSKSNLVAIGDSALYNNAIGATLISQSIQNTAVGSKALTANTVGSFNTALGYNALFSNSAGIQNTALGTSALFANTLGENNVAVGNNALRRTNGNSNIALGTGAMFNHTSGISNTAVGTGALSANPNGSNNVAVGANAGAAETGSDKLYIESSNADKNNALIYGDFAADSILLNAKTINRNSFNIRTNNALEMGYGATGKQTDAGKICYGCFGDPAHWLGIVGGGTNALGSDRVIKLWSEGGLRIKGNTLPDLDNSYSLGNSSNRWNQVWAVSGFVNSSDARLKTNIAVSPYGLKEVMKMQPVQYNWKTNPTEDLQIGFLAQDIQKIIPEAVVEPANGDPLGMKYAELIPVLVKGMQEQQKLIESQQKQIDELHKLLKAKL